MLVEIPEQGKTSIYKGSRTVLVLLLKTSDVVIDKLRGGGIIAYGDEGGL